MRGGGNPIRTVLLLVLTLLVPLALATAVPVNPVVNGGFEAFAPGGAVLLPGSPADRSLGVGHQVLGCTQTSNLVFGSDCHGNPADAQETLVRIASNPNDEIAAWTAEGPQSGDLAVVSPADQNVWYAAGWSVFPERAVDFRSVHNDLNRQAVVAKPGAMLYQTFTTNGVPAGAVADFRFAYSGAAPAGGVNFVLDAFPFESAGSWPQAFLDYQLWVPASAWSVADGVAHVDLAKGTLSGPAAGAFLVDDGNAHPTAAQWNAATPEQRHAMLANERIVQFTLQSLPVGAVVDDVTMDLSA